MVKKFKKKIVWHRSYSEDINLGSFFMIKFVSSTTRLYIEWTFT